MSIVQLVQDAQHSCSWVPSHGKHPDWEPLAGLLAQEIRDLNHTADEEASGMLRTILQEGANAKNRRAILAQWTQETTKVRSMRGWS